MRSPTSLELPKVFVIGAAAGASVELDRALRDWGCAAIWHGGATDDPATMVERLQPDLVLIDHQGRGSDDHSAVTAQGYRQLGVPVLALDEAAVNPQGGAKSGIDRIRRPFSTRELGLQMELTLQRHRSESIRQARDEAWELVFDDSPVPMLLTLPNLSITGANASFMALSGYTNDEMIGRAVQQLGLRVDDSAVRRLEHTLTRRDHL